MSNEVTVIDLSKYGKPHPVDERVRYYLTVEEGRETAEKCGLKEALLAGKVNVCIHSYDERRSWICGLQSMNVRESWIRGFIGPVAREIGIDLVMKNLSINGSKMDTKTTGGRGVFWQWVVDYLVSEQKRLEKVSKEKDRKEGKTTWSDPGNFLIPDIGTVVSLTEDWTFELHKESRNDKLLEIIGVGAAPYSYEPKIHGRFPVTIKAGALLSVDRVYIRKGVSDYSSITFNLRKGSELEYNGKTYKAHGRFWAKLSAVNKMKVQIDLQTIAEN